MSSLHADPLGPHSDVVSTARLLLESKGRRASQQFLVEGPQNVIAAIENSLAKYVLTISQSEVSDLASANGIKAFRISEAASKTLSDTKTPQGVFAVCEIPQSELENLQIKNYVVVLDRVSDPGNVGTVIRTAAAFGADAVISLAGSADIWSGKVIRSTAGAFAMLPIFSQVSEDEILQFLHKHSVSSFALTGSGETQISDLDLSKPHAWLVGNEAGGLTENLMLKADQRVSIPMSENVESLNAAMAAGICSFASFTSINI